MGVALLVDDEVDDVVEEDVEVVVVVPERLVVGVGDGEGEGAASATGVGIGAGCSTAAGDGASWGVATACGPVVPGACSAEFVCSANAQQTRAKNPTRCMPCLIGVVLIAGLRGRGKRMLARLARDRSCL